MRWIIRTLAVFSVVSWIVVAGLFARPVVSPERLRPRQEKTLESLSSLPLDWTQRVLAGSPRVFPGAPFEQAAVTVPIVERHAKRFGIDPLLVLAVIQVESRFDPAAVSTRGAVGLMQIQPPTARGLAMGLGMVWTGDDLLLDPELNVLLGCAYLRQLIDRFGDQDAALSAYCSGPTLVESRRDRRGRIPLAYSDRVWDVLTALRGKVSA